MNDKVEDFINHHGIKGMRWGIRNKRNVIKPSGDAKKAAALRRKKPSELSTKQLKSLNERMNLEQNARRLNPTSIQRGTLAASSILTTLGIGVTAYNMVTSPAGKAAIAAGKKALGK